MSFFSFFAVRKHNKKEIIKYNYEVRKYVKYKSMKIKIEK